MIKHLLAPDFHLANTYWLPVPSGKFTPEQVAAMQSYGFTESAGDWSLGLSDAILFAKMTTNCSRKASNKSKPWQPNWPRQG